MRGAMLAKWKPNLCSPHIGVLVSLLLYKLKNKRYLSEWWFKAKGEQAAALFTGAVHPPTEEG